MPLTAKGEKIMSSMKSEYGDKKGEKVFYATKNKGEIAGVDSDNSFKKGDRVKDQHGETFEVISSNGNMVKVWSKNASGGKDYHYTKLSRNDAFPPGYQDVVYNGHKIIIGGAGDYYAVFKNGVVLKSKFISVDEAKKWIDRKDETGPSQSDPSMTIAERIDTMAQQIGGLSAKVKDIVRSDASKQLSLWKYNKRSGIWDYQRTVTEETKDQWLSVFKNDEPSETFRVALNKPSGRP